MSFSLSGSVITQSGTDTDLSGIEGNGATRSFEGEIAVYTVADGNRLDIGGTCTVDPEKERLNFRTNRFLIVLSGGRLNLGATTTRDEFKRYHTGVAICNSLGQPVWYGSAGDSSGQGMGIESGGELHWISGTIQGPFGLWCANGSSVWIENGISKIQDVEQGTIDPQTGNTVVQNAGTYVGVTNINSTLLTGRGFIGYFLGPDIRVDNLLSFGGGEHIFNSIPTGTNTISGTANGYLGYSGEQDRVAMFPRTAQIAGQDLGLFDFSFSNIALGGKGNYTDMAVQSIGDRYANITVTNAAAGTLLNCKAAEQHSAALSGGDFRNRGSVAIYRDINFDFFDGLSPSTKLSGGRYYMIDTDHGNRKDKGGSVPDNQGFDFDQTFTYSDTFTSGTLTNNLEPILLGAVQSIHIDETKVFPNRDNDPTQTVNPDNTVSPTASTVTWRMDVRGNTNVLGADLFSFHIWHPSYNYNPQVLSLSEGTTGTYEISAGMTADSLFTGTAGATPTSVANLDEVYDALKNRKIVSTATIIEPSSSTLWASESSGFFDVGDKNITVTTGTTTGGFTPASGSYGISIGSNSSLITGSLFTGLKTSLNISCTNINLPTVKLDTGTVNNVPNPILDDSNIKAITFTDFPLSSDISTEAVGNCTLEGKYSEASDQSSSNRFLVINELADVSKLELAFNSSGNVELYGVTNADFDTNPINNGSGSITFPTPKSIVVTAPSGNTVGEVYATYGGSEVTVTQGTNAEGNRTFSYTTTVAGDFNIGLWIDGFNYSQVKLGSAVSGSFSLVPIDGVSLGFDGFTANTSLITAILANATTTIVGSGTTAKLLISLDESVIDNTLTDHTAILGNNARLLMRRLLESDKCIEFLLGLASNATTFFTFDSVGFTIAYDDSGHKFELQWDEVEDKDLIINVFVKDGSGNALFAKIINTAPGRSPTFAPAEFVNITQSATSVSAFEEVIIDVVKVPFKKTSRAIPVNDSDF